MNDHREEYEYYIDGDFDVHLENLKNSSKGNKNNWGEFIHVKVFSEIIDRSIYIFLTTDNIVELKKDTMGRPLPENFFKGKGDSFFLFFNGYNHWSWLQPKGVFSNLSTS